MFTAGAATKVEYYEISSYEGQIRMADEMGHSKVSKLLGQNLKEEQQAAQKMQKFEEKLKPENWDMGEEEAFAGAQRGRQGSGQRGSRTQSKSQGRQSGSKSRSGRSTSTRKAA